MRRKGIGFALAVIFGLAAQTHAAVSTGPVVSISSDKHLVESSTYTLVSSTIPWRTVSNDAFRPGESLLYSIKWGVIKGGNSTLEVREIQSLRGRSVYHIYSEAHSTGLVDTLFKTRDQNETWVDVQSLTTLRYEKHIREGKFRMEEEIDLDQENHRFHNYKQRLDKGTTQYVEGPIPPHTLDVLGSLYYVRTLPLEVGQTYTIDVYDNKKIWPLVVNVIKREKIKVAAGKFTCLRVEPILREPGIFVKKGKKLEVWMTDDAIHLPVLMRSEVVIGHVTAELVKYQLSVDSSTPQSP